MQRGLEQINFGHGENHLRARCLMRHVVHPLHDGQSIKTHQIFTNHPGGEFVDAFLLNEAQAPIKLHLLLKIGICAVRRVEVCHRGE